MKKAILAILFAAISAWGQIPVVPMYEPKIQFLDSSGNPLAGGYLCSYVTGSSTPLATYTDSTGGTSNSNPVQLDAGGRANIWLGASTYRLVLYDSTGSACTGSPIWSVDGVQSSIRDILATSVNKVQKCDQFAGATAGAKIIACIAALPSTGGTADARGFEGAQTITATVTVNKPVTLLFGAATFTASAFPAFSITSAGVKLQGLGSGTSVLKTADSAAVHDQLVLAAFSGDGLEIAGMTFDHNAAGTPRVTAPATGNKRRTVEITSGNHIRIHDNEVKNTSSVHSFMVNGTTIEDVWIHNNRFTNIGNDSGLKGSHTGANNAATLTDSGAAWTVDGLVNKIVTNLTDASRGTITANTATTITATLASGTDNDWDAGDTYTIQYDSSLIYVDAKSETPVSITDNIFEATTVLDPGAFTAIETHGSNTVVRGNIIRNFYTGMNITGSAATDSRNIVVENNVMDQVIKGIALWSAEYGAHTTGYGLDGVTVQGNHIYLGVETTYAHAAGEFGIMIEDPAATTILDVRGLKIKNNVITHPLEAASVAHNNTYSYAIGWRSATDKTISDSEITGNTIINFPRGGIYLECGLVNVKIDGNILKNTGSTVEGALNEIIRSPIVVRAPTVTGVSISDNIIADDIATTRFLYPITVASEAGGGVIVRDNHFSVSGTKNASFLWIQPLVSAAYHIKPFVSNAIPDITYQATLSSNQQFAQGSKVFDTTTGREYEIRSEGYSWKPLDEYAGADQGDAGETLTVGTDEPIQNWNTALGADRTITLDTTGAKEGDWFHILRNSAATGAFNLIVGSLRNLSSAGQWCKVQYDGAAWQLIAYGTLLDQEAKRVSADNGDAAASLVVGISETTQRWNTAIAADRAVTLSTTGARSGDRFRIVREAGATGGFNINVGTGPLKALAAASTWCEVEYDGAAWRLTAYGAL